MVAKSTHDSAARLSSYAAPDTPSALVRARRTVGARVVARAFVRASALGRLAKDADPARHGVEVLRDIPYLKSGLAEHTLDVWRPIRRDGPRPVVLYVHGGAFWSLSKDTHWIMALAFARRGFVVANVNYRLAPKHRFPAGLADVAEAYRFVAARAGAWGGDPTTLVLAGESAGANLITSLALCRGYERDESYARVARSVEVEPRAVMAACGVFEVSNGARFHAKYAVNWFFQDRYGELEQLYAPRRDGKPVSHDLMNPVCLVEREAPRRPLPPFFLPVGALDHLKDDTARLERALQRHGVDVEAPVYPRMPHAFHGFAVVPSAKRCWQDHWSFLERRGVPIDRSLP